MNKFIAIFKSPIKVNSKPKSRKISNVKVSEEALGLIKYLREECSDKLDFMCAIPPGKSEKAEKTAYAYDFESDAYTERADYIVKVSNTKEGQYAIKPLPGSWMDH